MISFFNKFMLYTKSSNNRESFSRNWLIWSNTKQFSHCLRLSCSLFNINLTETSNTISIIAKREGFYPCEIP